MNMKGWISIVVFLLAGSTVYAEGPDFIWAGGGLKVSDDSNPCYFADAFVLLSQTGSMSVFTQPVATVRGGKPGLDLGIGGRVPC
jgi:hypothetical protein